MKKYRSRFFWLLFVCLGLLLIEAGLRTAQWIYLKAVPPKSSPDYPKREPISPARHSDRPARPSAGSPPGYVMVRSLTGEGEMRIELFYRGGISRSKPQGVKRVICLGDSCTYGREDPDNYPYRLGEILRDQGIKAQAVNGGRPGLTAQVLEKLTPSFLLFNPDTVTIYIGWNDIGQRPQPGWREKAFHSLRIIQLFAGPGGTGSRSYYRELKNYPYQPPNTEQLRGIIRQCRMAGVEPVLLTLPGRFQTGDPQREKALAQSCPENIGNAFILAKRTEIYNQALRELAKAEKIPLVDLAAWGKTALEPREKYFSDSIHPSPAGYRKIGDYLGQELSRRWKARPHAERGR